MSYRCFKITIITLIAVICLCLGIGIWASIPRKNNVGDKAVYNGSSLYSISNTKLIYDENTRVIYYWLHSGYMSPYYNDMDNFAAILMAKLYQSSKEVKWHIQLSTVMRICCSIIGRTITSQI